MAIYMTMYMDMTGDNKEIFDIIAVHIYARKHMIIHEVKYLLMSLYNVIPGNNFEKSSTDEFT